MAGFLRRWVLTTGVFSWGTHEDDALVTLETGEVHGRDVVLAFALPEGDDRDVVGGAEGFDGCDEGVRHRRNEGDEAKAWPRWSRKNPTIPHSLCSRGV